MTDMKKYLFLALFLLAPLSQAHATIYYIDFTNGLDSNNGLGTTSTSAFQSLDKFAENARSNGDIAFVRRGMASTTNVSALTPTSAAVVIKPIIIEADYDNLWNDFATSSETWNVIVGSTYMASSASTTSAFPGKWIYIQGDCFETATTSASFGYNDCPYAYEISEASSTGIRLYLPYKGQNSGSAQNMRVMPSAPQWNTTSGNFQIDFSTAQHDWILKGLDLRSSSVNGIFKATAGFGRIWQIYFMDDIFVSSQVWMSNIASGAFYSFTFNKIRTSGITTMFSLGANSFTYLISMSDSYLNLTTSLVSSGAGAFSSGVYVAGFLRDIEISGETVPAGGIVLGGFTYLDARNVYADTGILGNNTGSISTAPGLTGMRVEDGSNISGNNFFAPFGTTTQKYLFSNTVPYASSSPLMSTTTVTRAGGGPNTLFVSPDQNVNSIWPLTYLPLFNYPIYTNTSSKTYTVYFDSSDTTQWTTNPTAKELWIECNEWVTSAGTSTSSTIKSTSTLNFTGSTAWQSLSVTCQPSRTGILYLRGWYAKPLEGYLKNHFYVDTTPTIQ